ncbi:phosphatase PAP2 family protein [Rhodospirillaceae bacterium SYSU D60014]|uniref:phosphatase PAP2 family protein n=1 Tax=Virgifigura deserti TaxID=2268457 RepID=UPI000E66A4E1
MPITGFRITSLPPPFLALGFSITLLSAPALAEDAISPLDKEWLLGFPANAGRFIAQPLAWDREDWTNAGFVGLGLAGLLLLDDPIRDASQDLRSDFTDAAADVTRPFGDTALVGAGTLGIWALGEAAEEPRLQRLGLDALQAVIISEGFTQGLKYMIGRERPDASGDSFEFAPLSGDREDRALPSGHATTAFAVATVIAEEYEEIPWVPWATYGLATGTALSRINDDEHWATDAAVGALIGYGVGKIVSAYSPFPDDDQLSVAPVAGSQVVGLRLRLRF